MQMLFDHASTPPPRPHTRTELTIPPDLEQLIMDCLEKDPCRRPVDAGVLAERLSPAACPNRGHVSAPRAGGKPMRRLRSAIVLWPTC